uniref:Uncharacterized protein n=1 Tax=Paramormyrops kingsleyae TaxID=1676925 RepID=A0A3B3R6S1_9TELE
MEGGIIRTLYTMEDLRRTGYGCPNPRHGLKLLRWLAKSGIYFDNNGIMRAQFQYNQYGFRYYSNYENILPALQWDQEYFEVGNLNSDGADALPYSVRAAYVHRQGNSYEYNMDRIVVQRRKKSDEIGAVYITEHSRWSGTLNSQNTFRISPDLIRSLQSSSRCTCEGLCLCFCLFIIIFILVMVLLGAISAR